MDSRRMYRRNRRFRKTRYRKPRFLNRGNSIKKNRYCPTIVSKCYGHEREIEFCKKILPSKNLVLETNHEKVFTFYLQLYILMIYYL